MILIKRKSKLPSKLKGLFCVCRMDRLVPIRIFEFLSNMAGLSKWISVNKKNCTNDFYTSKFDYSKRETLYEKVITDFNLDSNIDYLEFGVSNGNSFRWWMNRIKDIDARFYGFDTFTGLPEDWGPFKKGDMGNGNAPPVIDDTRHEFYQGLFQNTLLPFLSSYEKGKQKVIHMDADVYSATLYVLTLITPFLKSGDILFFDEFTVPRHEFKAFIEWSSSFYIDYEVLGGVNNFYQVAFRIK